jgi:hypothetical protein
LTLINPINNIPAGKKSKTTKENQTTPFDANVNNLFAAPLNGAANNQEGKRTRAETPESLYNYSEWDDEDILNFDDDAVQESGRRKQAAAAPPLAISEPVSKLAALGIPQPRPAARPAIRQVIGVSNAVTSPKALSPPPPPEPELPGRRHQVATATGNVNSTDGNAGNSGGLNQLVPAGDTLFGGNSVDPQLWQQFLLFKQMMQQQATPLAVPTAGNSPHLFNSMQTRQSIGASNLSAPSQPIGGISQVLGGIPTDAECLDCAGDKGITGAMRSVCKDLFDRGNIYASEATVQKSILDVLKLQKNTYGEARLHIFQRAWHHAVVKDNKTTDNLWKCFQTKMKERCRVRSDAARAWMLSLSIAYPTSKMPTKKEPNADITAKYDAVDSQLKVFDQTGLVDNDLHRVTNEGGVLNPVGSMAIWNAALAYLHGDAVITTTAHQEDSETMVSCRCTEYGNSKTQLQISHLQLGSISQVIKFIVRNGYSQLARRTVGIGMSVAPETAAEAEKIWTELKVSNCV